MQYAYKFIDRTEKSVSNEETGIEWGNMCLMVDLILIATAHHTLLHKLCHNRKELVKTDNRAMEEYNSLKDHLLLGVVN